MGESLIFSIYLAVFAMVGYSLTRQALILYRSTNGTRFTQWTFLVFNTAYLLFTIGKLLDLKGVKLYYPEEIRAFLMLIMATVGFVFYSQGNKQ